MRRALVGAWLAILAVVAVLVAVRPPVLDAAAGAFAAAVDPTGTEGPAVRALEAVGTSGADRPAPLELTIAASGDLLPHQPVLRRAAANAAGEGYDFTPMLAPVAPVVRRADLAICHLEVPLSPDNSALSSYPVFNAPRELAAAVAGAGYDACSTASNHSLDQGAEGLTATLDVLDAAGLRHAGTGRSPYEAATPTVTVVGGAVVAHLSHTYGLNGFRPPPDRPWLVNMLAVDDILARAAHARRLGADLVIVSLHWGVEYRTEPTAEQRRVAGALTASPDVDLVLGHHAHVVQPIERVNGKPVVYGMGNLLSNQSGACCPAATQDGVVVLVTVEGGEGGFAATEVRYVPTYVTRPDYRVVPVADALADPELPAVLRAELQASWERTTAVLGDTPGVARPLQRPPPRR